MEDTDKKILVNLTKNQAGFLLDLFDHNTITANASRIAGPVRFSGKIVSKLRDLGIAEPMGFDGTKRQWSLTPKWEEKKSKSEEEIKSILNRIAK